MGTYKPYAGFTMHPSERRTTMTDELRIKSLIAQRDELLKALEGTRRSHFVLEDDCWYSCPKSGRCCNDNAGDDCNCGADAHNARIDAVIAKLPQAQPRQRR